MLVQQMRGTVSEQEVKGKPTHSRKPEGLLNFTKTKQKDR